MEFIGAFHMKRQINSKINYEKISAYFAGLALMITLWSVINQTQRDLSDLRERVARLEVKIERLEK